MKKTLALLLAIGMVVALLVGCETTNNPPQTEGPTQTDGSQTAPVETPSVALGPDGREIAAEQIYRTLYSGEVSTMNYLSTGTTNDLVVGANTIDSLVENDAYGNIVPSGAERWEVSDDGLTWTFYLRQGQKWYDNTGAEMGEVTANDYVAALRYVCDATNDAGNFYLVGDWIVNATEYFDYTAAVLAGYQDANGNYLDGDPAENADAAIVPEVKPEDIGVVAVDEYTLEYHLEIPRPYFLTALQFGCYWPAPAQLLEEYGLDFAIDNTTMWFNGAYILSEFESNVKRVYTKNENNWDAEHIYIERIEQTYNSEAATIAPEMFLRGEADYASIGSDIISDWQSDPEKAKLISSSRIVGDYSYFMGFNFEPKFDAQYEPENWAKAVNNENFRKSIFYGLDRVTSTEAYFPGDDPQLHLISTVTPKGFAVNEGKDYVTYGDLAAFGESFDAEKAVQYRDTAKAELEAAGVTFPIKIPMNFNPSVTTWGNQCTVIEQQLENLLGADYIDIVVLTWSGNSFLGETRRNGNYAIQLLNWGADYADPETWTDPFAVENSYNFAYAGSEDEAIAQNTKTPETLAMLETYFAMVDEAKAEYFDIDKRFELFANAEAYYLEHAMVIPMFVSGGSYQATKLNQFEGQFAAMGQSTSRYKGQHVYTTAMTMEQFQQQYAAWTSAMNAQG